MKGFTLNLNDKPGSLVIMYKRIRSSKFKLIEIDMIALSKYKNKKSIVLESTKIRAEFIPDPGGKLASFINKETGYEYMLQRKNEKYLEQPFSGVFVDGECSGFDDMFPTIDTCKYQYRTLERG